MGNEQIKQNRRNVIIGIIVIIVVFICICFAYRKWAISHSIEVTVKVTSKTEMYAGDNLDGGYQYGMEYYDSPLEYDKVLEFFDLQGTKTNVHGYRLGTFQSDKKYEVGDTVEGYLRKRKNEHKIDGGEYGYYFIFLPK